MDRHLYDNVSTRLLDVHHVLFTSFCFLSLYLKSKWSAYICHLHNYVIVLNYWLCMKPFFGKCQQLMNHSKFNKQVIRCSTWNLVNTWCVITTWYYIFYYTRAGTIRISYCKVWGHISPLFSKGLLTMVYKTQFPMKKLISHFAIYR